MLRRCAGLRDARPRGDSLAHRAHGECSMSRMADTTSVSTRSGGTVWIVRGTRDSTAGALTLCSATVTNSSGGIGVRLRRDWRPERNSGERRRGTYLFRGA